MLEGKKVILVEDTIVRSTTMKALIHQIRDRGRAKEVHVRVACPPIVAPCFYGIDMSTKKELFAPKFMNDGELTPEIESEMARAIGADTLRYLPISAIARSIGMPTTSICQACINGNYPTEAGKRLYQLAVANEGNGSCSTGRTYDAPIPTVLTRT